MSKKALFCFVCLFGLLLAGGSREREEEIGGASRRLSPPANGDNAPAQDLEHAGSCSLPADGWGEAGDPTVAWASQALLQEACPGKESVRSCVVGK